MAKANDKSKPPLMAPAWNEEPMTARLEACRIQLAAFLLLTEGENEKVKRRLVSARKLLL